MATCTVNPANMDDGFGRIDRAPKGPDAAQAPEKLPIDQVSGLPMLSRRAMLGGLAASTLAMGGMMMLPKERGGVLFAGFNPLGAEKAYAGSGTIWSGSFSFDVVGTDEVGLQIMDVSGLSDYDEQTIEKNGIPVEDATVTLTSLFNDQVVSGRTDEEGKVILSIRALAFSANPPDGVFRANCALSVKTEDARVQIRDFSTGRVCFEGATGYVIGVHELEDTDAVYMERCTFDDWDIHYSRLTFLRSATNEVNHTIKVCARGMADGDLVTLEILNAEDTTKVLVKEKTAQVKLDSDTGLAECTFKGKFLKTGNSDCISKDDAILRITLNTGGKTYGTDLEILVEDTPFEEVKLSKPILPIVTDPSQLASIGATGDWPCFNGLSLGVMGPFPGIQVSTTILTTFVGIGTDIRMLNDDGKWAPSDCWKQDHKGNMVNRYKGLCERKQSQLAQREGAKKDVEMEEIGDVGEPGEKVPQATQQKNSFLGVCQVNVIGRIALLFQWNGKTGVNSQLNGQGTVELGLSASGTATVNFMAGPVPMYLSGTLGFTALGYFNLTTQYSLTKTVDELDCADMHWAVNKNGGLLLKALLSISLGVGYKGLCSLSFDATFTFPFNFAWGQATGLDKKDPRITVGVTILLEIVLQALVFRLSGQIFSYQKNDWYDSWNENSVSNAPALTGDAAWNGVTPRFRMTHPDGTFRHTIAYDSDGNMVMGSEDPWSLAVPTTDAMMKGSKEANATRIGGNNMTGSSAESQSLLREQHIASFEPVAGQPHVFVRAANADGGQQEQTTVFVGKMPKAVVNADGEIVTELVDCEGVNTFYFGETTPDMIAAAVGGSGAAAATRPVKGNADAADPASAAASATLAAGSLTAQEDERFEGDPLLGFALGVTPEYRYTSVEGKTTHEICDPIGIKDIADHDGVIPNVNAVIYRDIHSDPRQRVVSIGGVLYLFRVVTVEYPTANNGCYCRTRVVASKYEDGEWGDPTVLEYNTGNSELPRVDIYDYEFDIAVRTGSKKWTQDAEAVLIVTGGLRPLGDDTSFGDAATKGTVAVLAIDKDLNVLQYMVRGVDSIDSSNAKLGFGEDAQHMVCSPCIVDGFGPDGASGSLAFAFLRRSSSTSAGVASTSASVTFCVGHCYVRDGHLSIPPDIKEDSSVTLAADSFGMKAAAGNAVDDKYDALLTLVVNHQNGYDVCTATVPPQGDFSDLVITHCIESSDKLPEIQPWPHHGTFLFVKERPATEGGNPDCHLYQGTFDALTPKQARFGAKQVDASGLRGSSFCVSPNGEFIFYYENYHDVPDSNSDTDSTNSLAVTDECAVHRIMASRFLNGSFCEDFPFCEVDHPIDHIEVVSLEGYASSFIATHLKDFDNGLADLHYIGIPNTLAAEIEAFVQSDPFVCAGYPAPFSMDVRNHGNLIIAGFDVQMLDADNGGELVDTVHIGQIEPSKISPTAANMGWGPTSTDAPKLTAEEEQGMLMPGKKISYKATFKIPETWEGKKKIVLRITNAWTPKMQASSMAAADDSSVLTASGNGLVMSGVLDGIHHFHKAKESDVTLMSTGEGSGEIYDPDEWVGTKPSPNPDDPNKKGGGSSKGTSAKTGDTLGSMGPLALAAAGAAALAAGYSARRLQNEREARKARESGEGEEA